MRTIVSGKTAFRDCLHSRKAVCHTFSDLGSARHCLLNNKEYAEEFMKKMKLNYHENKQGDGIETPRLSLSYGGKGGEPEQREQSLAVIRALAGNNGCIVEVQSAFFALALEKREHSALDFLHTIERTKLDFRYRSSISEQSASFLGRLFGMKNSKALNHFILVAVDSSSLANDSLLSKVLPYYGVRYYFMRDGNSPDALLDPLFNGQLYREMIYEKIELSVFDCCFMGQMGIYSLDLTRKDIEKKLSSV
jgi:hypothetical protein